VSSCLLVDQDADARFASDVCDPRRPFPRYDEQLSLVPANHSGMTYGQPLAAAG
jgi:hypothetical protein